MADPLSIAGSVVGIAAAGLKVSISLFALAETVATASQRVESIANDISSTCGILNQLHDLIDPKPRPDGTYTSMFTRTALSDITAACQHCHSLFKQVRAYLRKATKVVQAAETPVNGKKIELSKMEKTKWPFLQPQFNDLRNDLRDSKSNLLLMVAVANLGLANRNAPNRVIDERERAEMTETIVRLNRAVTADARSFEGSEEEKKSAIKAFFKKLATFGSRSEKDKVPTRALDATIDEDEDDGEDWGDEKLRVPVKKVLSRRIHTQQGNQPNHDGAPQPEATLPAVTPKDKNIANEQPEDRLPSRSPSITIQPPQPDAALPAATPKDQNIANEQSEDHSSRSPSITIEPPQPEASLPAATPKDQNIVNEQPENRLPSRSSSNTIEPPQPEATLPAHPPEDHTMASEQPENQNTPHPPSDKSEPPQPDSESEKISVLSESKHPGAIEGVVATHADAQTDVEMEAQTEAQTETGVTKGSVWEGFSADEKKDYDAQPVLTVDAAVQTVALPTLSIPPLRSRSPSPPPPPPPPPPGQVLHSAPPSPGVGPSNSQQNSADQMVHKHANKGKGKATSAHNESSDFSSEPYDEHETTSSRVESPTAISQAETTILHAWSTGALPGLASGLDRSVTIHHLSMAVDEIEELIQQQDRPLKALSKLNSHQRRLVLDHVEAIDSRLLYVGIWNQESMPTVFGELELVILIWVTKAKVPKDVVFDSEEFFGRSGNETRRQVDQNARRTLLEVEERARMMEMRERAREVEERAHTEARERARMETRERAREVEERARKVEERVWMEARAAKEAAEAKAALEAAKRARMEAEAKAAKQAAEAQAAHDAALAAAKAAAEHSEMQKRRAEEQAQSLLPKPDEKKAPVNFKDAVGRKFSFPFHLVKTWKGMESMIRQAFLHVDVIGPHVHEGHYDLVGPDGDIILPQVWEHVIQPGWTITMQMWPIPDTSLNPSKQGLGPPPPPPPMGASPWATMSPAKPKKGAGKKFQSDAFSTMPPPPPPPPPPMSLGKQKGKGNSAANMPPPPVAFAPPPPPPPPPIVPIVEDSDSEISSHRRKRRGGPSPFLKWAAGAGSVPKPKLFKSTMMLDRMNDDSDSDLTSVGHYEPWKSKGKGKDEGRMATNTGGVKDGEHDKVVERLLMKWIENEAPQVDVPPSNEKDEKTQAGPSSGPAQPKLTVEDWI